MAGDEVNGVVLINPNINPDFPDDAPDKMILKVKELGIDFPYQLTRHSKCAYAFRAQCTPDIYIILIRIKCWFITAALMIIRKEAVRGHPHEEELKEAMNNMAAGRRSCKQA